MVRRARLAPADVFDPVVEEYKKHIDMTQIRENLKRTPHERAERMQEAIDCMVELQRQRKNKVVPISAAASQLGRLVTDALSGEPIYLMNGDQMVRLMPCEAQKIDFDSRGLKAELLAGLEGKTEPYSDQEMRATCHEALRKKKKT